MGSRVHDLIRVALVLGVTWGGAAAQEAFEHPLILEAPEGLCAVEDPGSGTPPESELQEILFGQAFPVLLLRPCDGSNWPAGTEIMVGLVTQGGTPRALDITREQYISRLARREGSIEDGALERALEAIDEDIEIGTMATGILARDERAVHLGFIHPLGSREQADWRFSIVGSSLLHGFPTIVISRGDYIDPATFQVAVGRHVAFTGALVEDNRTWNERFLPEHMGWIKYAIAALLVLGGIAGFWNWCRLRRRHDADDPMEDEAA